MKPSPTTNARYYPPGDHVLWSDIIADRTPLQALDRELRWNDIVMAYTHATAKVSNDNEAHTIGQVLGFISACQVKWELSARVADMFTSPNAGLILGVRNDLH